MQIDWIQVASILFNLFLVLLVFLYFPLTTILFRYYLNTYWKNAFGIMLGNALVNAFMIFQHLRHRPFTEREFSFLVLQTVLVVFVTTLLLNIFYRWGINDLTNEERTPGAIGFQAWLSWPNSALCAAISLTVAIMSIHRSNPFVVFLITFFICICVFLLYPFVNTMRSSKVPLDRPEDINQARLKILDLLENGKISSEECTELLKAVKQSQPTEE